jgi:hypothetical protein
MNPVTPDDVPLMVQVLRNLHDEIGRFLNEYGDQPSPNSLAAVELRTFQRPESLTTTYSQGSILVEVAADQLMAFTKTVTEPVQTVAPWTCVRAVIESCALAAWLLDPNLDARTRVQRSFAFRYEGLIQQVKFGRASGNEAGTAKATARIDEVERVALGLGFSREKNRKGKRIGIAQQMPNITDIVAQTLDEEAVYRMLSAMAHAHHWALQQLSFQRVEDGNAYGIEGNADGGSVHLTEKNLEPISIAFLCNKAANTFAKPIWYKCQLFGWDIEYLRGILDSAFTGLGLQRAGRQL